MFDGVCIIVDAFPRRVNAPTLTRWHLCGPRAASLAGPLRPEALKRRSSAFGSSVGNVDVLMAARGPQRTSMLNAGGLQAFTSSGRPAFKDERGRSRAAYRGANTDAFGSSVGRAWPPSLDLEGRKP